jgi:hypothetical protein
VEEGWLHGYEELSFGVVLFGRGVNIIALGFAHDDSVLLFGLVFDESDFFGGFLC